jgi:RimJ/RimL family protein N-acetyltransferase
MVNLKQRGLSNKLKNNNNMQLKNDLDSVIRFRNELTMLSEDLEDSRHKVESDVEELHETWNDPKFQQFYDGYQQDDEFIRHLIENINDFNDGYLYNMQVALEDYHY